MKDPWDEEEVETSVASHVLIPLGVLVDQSMVAGEETPMTRITSHDQQGSRVDTRG